MKDLKAIKGTFYIHNLISEGEHEHQDFKFARPRRCIAGRRRM